MGVSAGGDEADRSAQGGQGEAARREGGVEICGGEGGAGESVGGVVVVVVVAVAAVVGGGGDGGDVWCW